MEIRAIIIGFGHIGQGFARLLNLKSGLLAENFGIRLNVVAIVDSKGAAINPNGLNLEKALNVKKTKKTIAFYPEYGKHDMDTLNVLESVDAEIVIEVTPTNVINGEPGLSFMLEAMRRGKHVITSNKGPLALAFSKLYEASKKYGVHFKFDATVGGATPMISLAQRCLVGNKIESIRGIMNATTNFILTKMSRDLCPFEEALKEAQKMGICEKNPTYDIKGIDTACKMVILANALMNKNVTYKDLQKIVGIENIGVDALKEAYKKSCAVKLVGLASENRLLVQPELIPLSDKICVDGTLNAVEFKTDVAKDIVIIGQGAGPIETASKILSDLIDIVKYQNTI
jgi:homoserine dehydrogenase